MQNVPQTIGLIGGTGRMGRLFQRLFEQDGLRVLIAGRRTELGYEALTDQADVVIVTVPIEDTAATIRRIAPRLRPGQLLTDFTSVKAAPVRAMLETPSAVIGCHPVFGPVPDLRGQNVVLCPARPGGWLPWYRGFFERHGMNVEEMDAAAHDRAMGIVQGLTHFVNIAYARTLRSSGSAPGDLLKVSSPVFRLFFATLARILSGDPALYGAIQTLNPLSREAVRAFLGESGELLATIERGDRSAFDAMFREAADYLGETRGQARAESDRLIGHPRERAESGKD